MSIRAYWYKCVRSVKEFLRQRISVVPGEQPWPMVASLYPLEPRLMLDAMLSAHVIAQFDGVIDQPGGSSQIMIQVSANDFLLAGPELDNPQPPSTVLGFLVTSPEGSDLDPSAVQIGDSSGVLLQPSEQTFFFDDIVHPSGTVLHLDSLVLAELEEDDYIVTVSGQGSTRGAFGLEVQMLGDLNSDRAVNVADQVAMEELVVDHRYVVEGDANLDGLLTAFDVARLLYNLGDVTGINPLRLEVELEPMPRQTLPDGSFLVTNPAISVVGLTNSGLEVELDLGADGTVDQTAVAAAVEGNFLFPITLEEGLNLPEVHVRDSFGQNRSASVGITFAPDLVPPTLINVEVNHGIPDPPDLPDKGAQPSSFPTQRSQVLNVAFIFSEIVVFTADDFLVTNLGVDADNDPDTSIFISGDDVSGEENVVTVDLSRKALDDGSYRFQVNSTVRDLAGNFLDANAEGTAGDAHITHDHVLAADFNGDGSVSLFDIPTFSYWVGQEAAIAPSYVNLNGDTSISLFDVPVLAAAFGKQITGPTQATVSQRQALMGQTSLQRSVSSDSPIRPRQNVNAITSAEVPAIAMALHSETFQTRRLPPGARRDHRSVSQPDFAHSRIHQLYEGDRESFDALSQTSMLILNV